MYQQPINKHRANGTLLSSRIRLWKDSPATVSFPGVHLMSRVGVRLKSRAFPVLWSFVPVTGYMPLGTHLSEHLGASDTLSTQNIKHQRPAFTHVGPSNSCSRNGEGVQCTPCTRLTKTQPRCCSVSPEMVHSGHKGHAPHCDISSLITGTELTAGIAPS